MRGFFNVVLLQLPGLCFSFNLPNSGMKKIVCQFLLLLVILLQKESNLLSQVGPAIKWQKCIGGSLEDNANDVVVLPGGNLLVVGSSKSNDGNITGHHGSTDTTDAWIAKLDTAGNIIWQKSIGGTGADYFNAIIATSDNNYLCIGQTTSNNGDVSGNHGSTDVWVVKINASGTILWSKCYGGTFQETAVDGVLTSDGGYALIGYTGSNNGDVSGFHGTPNSNSDIWIIKLGSGGNIMWQKCYGNSAPGQEFGRDIIEDSDKQLVASVHPSDGYNTGDDFSSAGSYYEYVIKVDKDNGNFIYKVPIFNRSSSNAALSPRSNGYFESINAAVSYPACVQPKSITYLQNNAGAILNQTSTPSLCLNPYGYAGYFAGAHGIATLTDSSFIGAGHINDTGAIHGADEAFIGTIKFVPGNVQSSYKKYGGSGSDWFTSIKILPTGNDYIAVGYTNSNDFDVSGNHGGYDCWIVRLIGVNRVTGNVFLDNNNNGIRDAGEPGFDRGMVKTEKTGFLQASVPYQGMYQNDIDTGVYQSYFVPARPYYNIAPSTKTSSFSSYKNYDTVNFAVVPIPGKRDYTITNTAGQIARPGLPLGYHIVYSNNGTDTLVNKPVIFIKDKHTHFLIANPAATMVSGDTISWNIISLLPGNKGTIYLSVKLDTIPNLKIGDTLIGKTYLDSTGDVLPADNAVLIRQALRSSYDPNDKTENKGGFIVSKDISAGNNLYYTIRFQNTGNDTAFNITVRDTLDAKTDWSTLQMEDADHAYQLNIKDGRYCTWQFNTINLVDSLQNEPLSHGYLTYSIKPQSSLLLGDTVRNSASIYFDLNPGINTNTQLTVVKSNPPPTPAVTGIKSAYCRNEGVQKGKIKNFPGAGNGITTIVRLDAVVLPVAADSTFAFDVSAPVPGTHGILVKFTNSSGADSTLYNFNITAAVVPDVNVSANITSVVNLTDPVIITASNADGGGVAPKYTFAKDKAITNILQAEGSAASLTIQPNTLKVGPNWIYVRMKTSDTCYTSQTNIDSIDIERSPITGLTDVDFPNQVINVYPNPFRNSTTISGLNAGKTYTITINNSAGQKMYSQQISSSRSAVINKPGLQSGKYWLSIYDFKKHTLIGTVSLFKE